MWTVNFVNIVVHTFLHLLVRLFSHPTNCLAVYAPMLPHNRALLHDYNISLRPSIHQLLKSLPYMSSLPFKAQSADAATTEIPVLLQAFKQTRHCQRVRLDWKMKPLDLVSWHKTLRCAGWTDRLEFCFRYCSLAPMRHQRRNVCSNLG